ncbi:glycoside hydrolase family 26 protein [Flavicella sediminum]|uniref:1,4-beta-xylanase n=1 Tax=Flavicella sediminum TaxID=2585141 RepID=UPI001120EEE2|nr:1,4-beta-xylanase [Flavicella sediminum]
MKFNSLIFTILFLSCNYTLLFAQKFEPKNGQCYVFIGQDLEATGGLDDYNNGYSDYFDTPAGITIYTNLAPNNESFGHYNKGLDGLKTKANWGAGDSWANLYLQNSTYQNSAFAIGLSFVNHEKDIAKGKLDYLIIELAHWIKSTKRPVFLRVGYEFDGWDWNHYKKKHYLNSWKRLHSIFQTEKVNNVAFVWQSKGTGSNQKVLEEWYPGDALVDWCAYSYFGQPDQEMIVFARKHKKPVFISEATPVRQIDNLYFDSDLKKAKLEKTIWREWFIPFFKTIHENSDVIKAFSYINSDWASQPMWIANPTFNKVDSRIQVSKYVSQKWKEEMEKSMYLNAFEEFRNENLNEKKGKLIN